MVDYHLTKTWVADFRFGRTGYIDSREQRFGSDTQEVDMSKFKVNDRVRIVNHTDPKYCGREGEVIAVNVKALIGTAGIAGGSTFPPPGKAQWMYTIDVGSLFTPVQCYEDWLESL